jgi:hypothetical protein
MGNFVSKSNNGNESVQAKNFSTQVVFSYVFSKLHNGKNHNIRQYPILTSLLFLP